MRSCGSCNLCCKLVPIRSLTPEEQTEVSRAVGGTDLANSEIIFEDFDKPQGKWCQHAKKGAGCGIYRERPMSCRHWSCYWLSGKGADELERPDRAKYVIDIWPDRIGIQMGHQRRDFTALQIWADRYRPDAHRDPALRRLLAKHNLAGLVRYSDRAGGLAILPPKLSPDGRWQEIEGGIDEQMVDWAERIAQAPERFFSVVQAAEEE